MSLITIDGLPTGRHGGINANQLLKFSKRNAKIGASVATLSLPAGHTCPGASECWSRVNPMTGKIQDGPHCQFRCFAAPQETAPNVRGSRWRNLRLLQQAGTVDRMCELILKSFPAGADKVRPNASGDYYSQTYFDSWCAVAERRPDLLIYSYTKSLPFWVARLATLPPNMILTASCGGKYDQLIQQYDLRFAKVVFSPEEAVTLGLEIDHDDSHAMRPGSSFALLIHGVQRKDSAAAQANADLDRRGIEHKYGRQK